MPLNLTELGKTLSAEVDAGGIAEKLAPGMVDKVAGMSNYDLQEWCNDCFLDDARPLTDEQIRKFKNCAYNHGVELSAVYLVCATELRDELLRLTGETVPA